jgi:hypothetical protein
MVSRARALAPWSSDYFRLSGQIRFVTTFGLAAWRLRQAAPRTCIPRRDDGVPALWSTSSGMREQIFGDTHGRGTGTYQTPGGGLGLELHLINPATDRSGPDRRCERGYR